MKKLQAKRDQQPEFIIRRDIDAIQDNGALDRL